MKPNYKKFLAFEFRKEMSKKGLSPNEKLIFDGENHEYPVEINGKKQKVFYCACYDHFGRKETVLIGSYGSGKKRYTFSKSTCQFN